MLSIFLPSLTDTIFIPISISFGFDKLWQPTQSYHFDAFPMKDHNSTSNPLMGSGRTFKTIVWWGMGLLSLNTSEVNLSRSRRFGRPSNTIGFRIRRVHLEVGFLAEWQTWSAILFISELLAGKNINKWLWKKVGRLMFTYKKNSVELEHFWQSYSSAKTLESLVGFLQISSSPN